MNERKLLIPKLTSDEISFIFSIYNLRHNTNEILLILPWVIGLFFSLLGVPFIAVFCNLSPVWDIVLFIGPILVPTIILFIRRRIIIDHFLIEKNVEGKVEIVHCASHMYVANDPERVLMFGDSENMLVLIYNWLNSLGVLMDGKLKIYRILYDRRAIKYIAVDMDDLQIPRAVLENFEKETANNVRFSDIDEEGRIVNIRYYARVTGTI